MRKKLIGIRHLSEKQHAGLDRISDKDPNARVIGWHGTAFDGGPVVYSKGEEKFISPETGRPRKIPAEHVS